MTKLYWTERSIPALKGLSFMERHSAKGSVHKEVWKHWEVWLPAVLLPVSHILALLELPDFPYKFAILTVSLLTLWRLSMLPVHYYLQHHLELKPWRRPSLS